MRDMEKVIFKKYVKLFASVIVILVQDPIWRYVDLKGSPTKKNSIA